MKTQLLSAMLALATLGLQAQTILHVSPTGTGTGLSWTDAANLETAVTNAPSGAEIWVQKGNYYPATMLTVPPLVKLYGGFAGTETLLSQRELTANLSVLDAQNKFGSIVRLEEGAVLNGFVVQHGNAQDNPHRNGGGVYAKENSIIENCSIINNTATANGGGIFANGQVTIINSTVKDNTATINGSNMYGYCIVIGSGEGFGQPCDEPDPSCDPCDPTTCTTPVITTQPLTTAQARNPGDAFNALTVAGTPTTHCLSFQWYFTKDYTNAEGTAIAGATSPSYIPSSTLVARNDVYYYCVVKNACGTETSGLSGLHTICFAPPTLAEHPSTDEHHKVRNTGDFPPLSVSAVGSGLSYQWRKTAFATSPSTDGVNVGINSPTYTPTSEIAEDVYYYCVITSPCGNLTSTVSGLHSVCAPPAITANPALASPTVGRNAGFATLSVTATGTAPLAYQWYSNTISSNTGGEPILGATDASYVPSSAVFGSMLYYYCVVTNACENGIATSNASGLHTVNSGCDLFANLDFVGSNLGTPYFKTNRTWTISGNGITQVWSDVVLAPGCNKETLVHREDFPFTAGCVRNTTVFPSGSRPEAMQTSSFSAYYGDLYTWSAVNFFADQLCPDDWRVPTVQDFTDLNTALESDHTKYADTSGTAGQFWGGPYGGCVWGEQFYYVGSLGVYWSSSDDTSTNGHYLHFDTSGTLVPWHLNSKGYGIMLRCVRDN
ncbi:MAG: hypothetical protein FWG79_09830 [Bacteroidales bacterium]|nr:hypothetical protein [Bacteroidales bacterium]